MNAVTYHPIGVIHTPFKRPENMPVQPASAAGIEGRVDVLPRYLPGLEDLEGFSHVVLLYHLHLSEGYRLRVKPFLDDRPRGLFATRAPRRPNPLGLSVVRLLAVDGFRLRIGNVDMVDGTPLLDIKPYVPDFDPKEEVRVGWLAPHRDRIREGRSDRRFRPGQNNT
jgi:tRNA-Thr(GGU) m(6)t(6)A37 methyltransferase TsaA